MLVYFLIVYKKNQWNLLGCQIKKHLLGYLYKNDYILEKKKHLSTIIVDVYDILKNLIYFCDYVNKYTYSIIKKKKYIDAINMNNNRKTNFMYKLVIRNHSSKPLGSILLIR